MKQNHTRVFFIETAFLTLFVLLALTVLVQVFGKVSMREGDTGEDVYTLQARLFELGYYNGRIDGRYSSETTAAVKAFRRGNGHPVPERRPGQARHDEGGPRVPLRSPSEECQTADTA